MSYRANLRPGVVVVNQRRDAAVRVDRTVAGAAIAVAAAAAAVRAAIAGRRGAVGAAQGRHREAGRQWWLDGGDLLLLGLVLLLLLLCSLLLLLLLLLEGLRLREQSLPVGANNLALVLGILVRGTCHVAMAQRRWRGWIRRALVALILGFGEEEILLVAVLVRLAGAVVFRCGAGKKTGVTLETLQAAVWR